LKHLTEKKTIVDTEESKLEYVKKEGGGGEGCQKGTFIEGGEGDPACASISNPLRKEDDSTHKHE